MNVGIFGAGPIPLRGKLERRARPPGPVASLRVQRIAWRILAAAALVAVLIVGRSSVEPGLVVATVGKGPDRRPAVIHGARTPIRHIVFIVKENRSYDNLFGLFPAATGRAPGAPPTAASCGCAGSRTCRSTSSTTTTRR